MNQLFSHLVEPFKILILLGIATTLSFSGWYFYAGPTPLTNKFTIEVGHKSTEKKSIEISEIESLNLFGDAVTSIPQTPVAVVENLRKTTLSLELIGTFKAQNSNTFSSALIAEKNRPAQSYQLNDLLPGGAVIVEIYADRIVISRGSEREQLPFNQKQLLRPGKTSRAAMESKSHSIKLPTLSNEMSPGSSNLLTQENSPLPSSTNIRRVVSNFEKSLVENANEALNSIGVEPVQQGTARGYRLGALATHPTLRQTGLQAGDVLLSVNDRAVGDISEDRLELSQMVASGSARLEIQRGDRRFFVTVSLQQ